MSCGIRSGALALGLLALRAGADSCRLPSDFALSPITYSGAGGGTSRVERSELRHYPVVMVPGVLRDRTDWSDGSTHCVYSRLLSAGFRPVELWMVDFARRGEEMTSIEEATDDLKFFICDVMRYTGANRVQILAHDTGCLLSRLTIQKYNIAHWIESEVYIAGPFHGVSAPDRKAGLAGRPNTWSLAPGSDLLKEVVFRGETPAFFFPFSDRQFRIACLTIRDGTGRGDKVFAQNPSSPALAGAQNVEVPGLDHEQLRTSAAAAEVFIPFLARPASPYNAAEDRDGDGFRSVRDGGPDLNDDNPAVYPGAQEIPGDGIDQDCNGCDLSAHRGRDGEIRLRPRRK